MAYGNKYYAEWASSKSNNKGFVYIDEDGFTDPSTKLTLLANPISIDYSFDDWNEPLIKLNASLKILNDKSNFYELTPLLSAEEKQYRLRIINHAEDRNLFEGFINAATITEKFIEHSPIKLTASNYVSKLDYLYPAINNTLNRRSLIDGLIQCLNLTGKSDNINVYSNLRETSFSLAGAHTLFNKTGYDTEIFWEDNIKRTSALDVIKTILKPFDSYLYWWDGDWFIDRYGDLDVSTKDYTVYSSDSEYGPNDGGTGFIYTDVSTSLNDMYFYATPTFSFIPGYGRVEVNLDYGKYNNLTVFPKYNSTKLTASPSTTVYPVVRNWKFDGDTNWYDTSTYKSIQSSLLRSSGGSAGWGDGFYTLFKTTVEGGLGTTLKFQWKWMGASPPITRDYTLKWMLRTPAGQYIVDGNNNHYRTGDAIWNSISVLGDDLIAPNYVHEISKEVLLDDASINLAGDQDFVFGIMQELYALAGSPPDTSLGSAYYGDVIITASSQEQSNLIIGETSANFLETKEIDTKLYDIRNLNYKNGLYVGGDGYPDRSTTWTDDGLIGTVFMPLTHRLIYNKFQLYNSTRQQLQGTFTTSDYLKPFKMYYDASQGMKPFTLTSYKYSPTKDEYKCTFEEYDNQLININQA